MNASTCSPAHRHAAASSARTGKACLAGWLALGLAALLAPTLQAQPPKPMAPAAPKPPAVFKTDILPSRLVKPDGIAAYLQKLEGQMAMLKRTNDPFGQVQDPSAPPPVVDHGPKQGPGKKATFADLISKVPVAAILAHENRFLAGGRSISQGDRFPLKTMVNGRQTLVQVEVMSVAPNKITFRNVATNETAIREIALMPPGMTSGTDGIIAPGMAPDNKDVPLEVGSPGGL